jgi:hypothetical protein
VGTSISAGARTASSTAARSLPAEATTIGASATVSVGTDWPPAAGQGDRVIRPAAPPPKLLGSGFTPRR